MVHCYKESLQVEVETKCPCSTAVVQGCLLWGIITCCHISFYNKPTDFLHNKQVALKVGGLCSRRIRKRPLSMTSTWSYQKSSRLEKETVVPTSLNFSRTCMDRIRLEDFGIITSTTRCANLASNNHTLMSSCGIKVKPSSSTT